MNAGNVLLPAWVKWAGLAAGLALFIGLAAWANDHFIVNPAVNAETARWQSRWDQRDLQDKQAEIDNQRFKQALERSRQDEIDRIQSDAEAEQKRLAALRAAAERNSERLQQGIEAAITSLRTGQNSGTTGGSKAGDSTGLLLAELYREIDQAAGDYAAEADRARAAGLTCERAYDALRVKP